MKQGTIFLTFAGRSGLIPAERYPKDPQSASPVLAAFAKYWSALADSNVLANDVARSTADIVRGACPAAASLSGAGIIEAAAGRTAQEWARTISWFKGWFGSDGGRCWHGESLAALKKLDKDFAASPALGAYRRDLSAAVSADGATPYAGNTIFAAIGWGLRWTAFLAAFPYSARVREYTSSARRRAVGSVSSSYRQS